MKKATHHRVNLNLELESLEVIDAFARATNRTRTYVIQNLINPTLPALRKWTDEEEKLSVYEQWAAESELEETLSKVST